MKRIFYRHSDWIPNKAATKYSKNNIYIKIEKSGDETDLCYAADEIGFQTKSYMETCYVGKQLVSIKGP